MLTSFNNDPARIRKSLEESTFSGRYNLNVPGPSNYVPFFEDPHIRLQKWGANMMGQDTIQLECDLKGLTRRINKNNLDVQEYKSYAIKPIKVQFPTAQPFVEETRASCPAWTFREAEQSNWGFPILNPQANLEKKFYNNIQTRILEKDFPAIARNQPESFGSSFTDINYIIPRAKR